YRCKNCSNTFATKELQSLHGTYLCVNRPFKHIGEEDIPLAVLKRHPLLQSTAKKRGRLPKAAAQVRPKSVRTMLRERDETTLSNVQLSGNFQHPLSSFM
ncbi:unnamed protein product, partial [Ixodes pacificus]